MFSHTFLTNLIYVFNNVYLILFKTIQLQTNNDEPDVLAHMINMFKKRKMNPKVYNEQFKIQDLHFMAY